MNVFLLVLDITLDGGVERVVTNMANYLFQNNYRVSVISLFHQDTDLKYKLMTGVPVFFIYDYSYSHWIQKKQIIKSSLLRNLYLSFLYTDKLYDIVKKQSGKEKSIVICSDYLRLPFRKEKNVFLVGEDHARYPFGKKTTGLVNFLRTWCTRNLDYVTTLNTGELELWKSLKKPVSVIPNYLPKTQMNCIKHSKNREKTVLSIGRMNTNQKGFDRLLDAYALIAKKYPDWKLKLFGSGGLQQKYKAMAREKGIDNFVVINDFTPTPWVEYQKASVYAMCSREEGFGMVLLEAAMNGVPLVAYDSDLGPRSIIKNNQTGFLVEDGNSLLFSQKLEELMNDYEKRVEFVENSQKDIFERFAEDSVMSKWKSLFEEILK